MHRSPMSALKLCAVVAVMATVSAQPALAMKLKYQPVSPSFGGQPNNAEWAKYNDYLQRRDDGTSPGGPKGPQINLPDFEELFKDFIDIPTIIIPVYN